MIRLPDVAVSKPAVEETRLRILTATRELYALKGSRGTTTREVAERAGVNEATLFRHFGTKQQLLSAMLDHFTESSSYIHAIEALKEIAGLEAQLHALGLAAIETMKRKEDIMKVGMAEEISNPDGLACAWRAPVEARMAVTNFMREKIESGELRGDPEPLARVFMSLFFAYVMARKLWNEPDQPEDAVRLCVDIFLNGARTR
jgi:AcrR family transcriptional regulator